MYGVCFPYFLPSLVEAVDDPIGFDDFVFAASFTDRGAVIKWAIHFKLYEPVHRLHLVVKELIAAFDATPMIRMVCTAANLAATSPELQRSAFMSG